ncbi:MAG: hypothetical protein LBN00_07750 [Oscillospiraceae bacterium]|jgi:hypothetical protein|nr:hypothetical protein [Oscillospiraceae bacterium]
MPDYEKMYFELAAKVADVVDMLIAAQQRGEDAYIESDEDNTIQLVPSAGEQTQNTP